MGRGRLKSCSLPVRLGLATTFSNLRTEREPHLERHRTELGTRAYYASMREMFSRNHLCVLLLISWTSFLIWMSFANLRGLEVANTILIQRESIVAHSLTEESLTQKHTGEKNISRSNSSTTVHSNHSIGGGAPLEGLSKKTSGKRKDGSKQFKGRRDGKKTLSPSTLSETTHQPREVEAAGFEGRAPEKCDGKRIYMYELPPKFNTLVLEQCERKMADWLNFCPHIENEGFGQALNRESGWYGTDFYMLEVIFHARMSHYSCLTHNPAEADAFFIPYYSGLDALRFLYGKDLNRSGEHGLELVSWLEEKASGSWKRRGGADHFMVMGRTAWDFARPVEWKDGWGTSLHNLPELANVTALFIESRPWLWSEQAIPYPTSFHPPSLGILKAWLRTVRSASRPNLFTFIGAPRPGPIGSIRQAVLEECLASPSNCGLLDCQKIKCAHNPEPIRDKLLLSEFCLQPPGDTPTRRSTFDGLLAGCIPVFFHNDSAYTQYTWHLPADADQYSVFIQHKDLQRGLRVQDVLSSYSRDRINSMRENIIRLIPGLIYMSSSAAVEMGGEIKDAFDLSLEGMLGRAAEIKGRSGFGFTS